MKQFKNERRDILYPSATKTKSGTWDNYFLSEGAPSEDEEQFAL